jgi:hypothetical protein
MSVADLPSANNFSVNDGFVMRRLPGLYPVVVPFSVIQAAITDNGSGSGSIADQAVTAISAGAATVSRLAEVTRLFLTSPAPITSYTVSLPTVATLKNGDTIIISTNRMILSLAFLLNGAAAVMNAPSALSAGSTIVIMYNMLNQTWYLEG